ncbi:MAG: mannose-6-phosphate isomerase, class I [Bacteroidetes bacterium MedPE-SWsnd-G1]|nr:MAG: mannose-6-phosphate isomerase, class I [Bacteroidetes bacterium MedPE-SWsnd-G1]
MSGLYKLQGVIQNYAWGGTEFIPKLLGSKPNEVKCAEYWLGAHNNATSTVFKGGNEIKLNALISKDTKANLGLNISEKFGRLPFLFKVLDVHDMLSIQVHPSKKEAEKGFKKENKLGIPLTASNRNYKDDNHKPEIMVALSEFWLLHGFLTEKKLITCLNSTPELSHLVTDFKNDGYLGLYKKLMEESQEVTNTVLQPLIERVLPLYKQGELDKNSPDYWAAKAYETFCIEGFIDKGIYSIYLFNIVQANKGEAVFQDAGIPHAYLEGQNMELMANSDNVLRGGLTPKHVDVPELLKHVEFQETIPNIMQGELQTDGIERIYKSPAPDFELSQLVFSKEKSNYTNISKTAIIYIVVNGNAKIEDSDISIEIKKGEAIVVLAESNYSIEAEGDAILYKATAPV